jgi:hypothetical protein
LLRDPAFGGTIRWRSGEHPQLMDDLGNLY